MIPGPDPLSMLVINISSLVGPSLRVPSFSGNSYLELDTLRCLVFSNSAPSSFKVIIIITIIIIIIIINIITIITIIIIRPKTAKLIFLPGKKLTPVRTIFPPAKIIFPYPKIIFPPPKTNLPPAKTIDPSTDKQKRCLTIICLSPSL